MAEAEVIQLPVRAPTVEVTEPLPPLGQVRLHFVRTTDDCLDLLRWASNKKSLAIDTETTGLSKSSDRVRLIQVGDEMDGWAVPFERTAVVIDDLVRRFEGSWDMHNAPYDYAMLDRHDIHLQREKIDDTLVMAHVLTSTGSLALKTLAQQHVDRSAGAAKQELEAGIGAHGGWTWGNVPIDFRPYWTYGALDPILTKRLGRVLRPQVVATALLSYELEMRVRWVCLEMELRGAPINRDYTTGYADTLHSYITDVEKWTTENYHFSPGSDSKVAEQLVRDGIPLSDRTPGGRLKLDKYILRDVQHYHPLAGAVLGRRQAQKTLGYLESYLELADADDRLHPNINTVGGREKNPFESGGTQGVRTGRMSMDSPNLQNVPIRTTASKRIRNCFAARCSETCGCGEEHVWIKCDFDQIEMRIFGHLAEDQALRAAFFQPVDVFTASGREMFADPTLTREDIRRQYVKNSFYAIIYGAGLEQFARTAGIRFPDGTLDLGNANAFLERLHQSYPGIKLLQRQIDDEGFARQRSEGVAYIRSPLTNRRFVADLKREYALLNYLVQGTAAEVLKVKIVEAADAGLGGYMVFPVHDEIDFDVPRSRLPEVMRILRNVMNDAKMFSVPITSTASIGPRWGDVEDVK